MAAFDSFLSDPYISNLLSASTSHSPRAPSPSFHKMSAEPASSSVPNLIHFLESVPPPVIVLLVELAPLISRLRWATEVLSWKSHWTDPWLTLASWWAVCLSTNIVLRYLLPLALLLPPLLSYLPSRHATHPQALPTTEQTISVSLSEITTIQTLMPTLPILPALPLRTTFRLSVMLFVPYTIITYFVPMQILIGVAGTILITYRAPWARTLRTVLWQSAYIRRFLLQLWSRLTGVTPPALTSFTLQPNADSLAPLATAPASRPIRFLFTILECQRWWMGLDWTAALLPGERPSWCSVWQQAVPPPSTFNLPPPTSIYLPAANGKKVKRTSTWRWEESEWGVWINKDGAGAKRFEKKPPGIEVEEGGSRIASRAASMLKERTASMGSRAEMSPTRDDRDASPMVTVGPGAQRESSEDIATDSDGWLYGDNKWEGAGPKGGMGKYTRYRRWTRTAVLEETVEEIRPNEADSVRGDTRQLPTMDTQQPTKMETEPASPQIPQDALRENLEREDEAGSLRQRIKSSIKGGTNTT